MRVVIAEDDHGAREALETLLRDEGHQVHSAPDGQAALTLVLSTSPDVVVTDYLMPELDGLALIRQARDAGIQAYFILVCGLAPEEAHALADLVLGKPLRIERLFEALEDLARMPTGRA